MKFFTVGGGSKIKKFTVFKVMFKIHFRQFWVIFELSFWWCVPAPDVDTKRLPEVFVPDFTSEGTLPCRQSSTCAVPVWVPSLNSCHRNKLGRNSKKICPSDDNQCQAIVLNPENVQKNHSRPMLCYNYPIDLDYFSRASAHRHSK